MATVTGFTAARMLAIENASVVDGEVFGDNLMLTRHDGTTIDAGSVRGPTGSPGMTQEEFDTQMLNDVPIGVVVDYIEAAAPNPNWLTMVGQTIVGGQTGYPILWSRIPASMKSGANIVMPDTRKRVSVGYDATDTDFNAITKTGGEKTHTLSLNEIPEHHHVIARSNISVTINDPGHNHIQNQHSHPLTDTGHTHPQIAHTHPQWGHVHTALDPAGGVGSSPSFAAQSGGGGSGYQSVAANKHIGSIDTTAETTAYNQETTAVNSSAATGISMGNTTPTNVSHTTDITASVNSGTFNSADSGSGIAHNNLQPYIVFLKIIKAA